MHAEQWCSPHNSVYVQLDSCTVMFSKPWRPNDQETSTSYKEIFIVRIVPIKSWVALYTSHIPYYMPIKSINIRLFGKMEVISRTSSHQYAWESRSIHRDSHTQYCQLNKKYTLLHCPSVLLLSLCEPFLKVWPKYFYYFFYYINTLVKCLSHFRGNNRLFYT